MKKKIVVFTLLAGLGYVLTTSYSAGAGQNCTGAKGSAANCSGSTCHGATASSGTDVYIDVQELAGGSVGSYVPGTSYNIVIGGSNPMLQTRYGFQFTTVQGSGISQTSAGSYTSFPAQVASNVYSGLLFVEHTSGIDSPIPGTFKKVIRWQAPPLAGAGIITMYLTLLAVNANNVADAGDQSGNVSITLLEHTASGISNMSGNMTDIKAFPNPAADVLQLTGNEAGSYAVAVYELSGRLVAQHTVALGALQPATISTATWQPGLYRVVVSKDGTYTSLAVAKER